jgi:hypothetical protein
VLATSAQHVVDLKAQQCDRRYRARVRHPSGHGIRLRALADRRVSTATQNYRSHCAMARRGRSRDSGSAASRDAFRFSLRLLNRGNRTLREYLDPLRHNHPRTSRPCPGVPFYREPGTIVECPAGDGTNSGKDLGGMGDRGAAPRAELDAQPPVAFVRTMFEGIRSPGCQFDILFPEVNDHGEGGSRATLAERAMTNSGADRLSRRPVSDCSAKTSSFVNFRHFPLSPPLSREGRGSLEASTIEKATRAGIVTDLHWPVTLPRLLRGFAELNYWTREP